MDINNVKLLGSPGQNVVIETAGRVYIKVQDRFYEVDFRNLGKSSSTTNVTNTYSEKPDLSGYVSKDYLKSALSQYVTTKTWQSVKATQAALEKAQLKGFTESISPITISTMDLLVGAEQLQYDFVNHLGHYTEEALTHPEQYSGLIMPNIEDLSILENNEPQIDTHDLLICNPGILKHYVYNGPEAVQSGMQDFQYCRWIVGNDLDPLTEKYYFPRQGLTADWMGNEAVHPLISDLVRYENYLSVDAKTYYLYIRASYLTDSDTKNFDTILNNADSSTWKSWWDTLDYFNGFNHLNLTFSELLSIYENLLGQKKNLFATKDEEVNFNTIWGIDASDITSYRGLEAFLIKSLYEFKVGVARYVLTESPLDEYEYSFSGGESEGEEEEEEIVAYNFLYAIVGNSGSSGRSITTLNGFTEITPGQVTAYIFKTPDGQQYINFKEGSLHIGEPYDNKKGDWMHYDPDTGLEISGKLTVTGGSLADELEKLTKLANGEYDIWYSDDAIYADPTLPNWHDVEAATVANLDGVAGKEEVEEGSEYSYYEQFFPFPNDADPDVGDLVDPHKWYKKKNWPVYLWQNPDVRSEHEGDLYVISRNIRTTGGNTPVTPDSDDERNNEVNLAFRYRSDKVKDENGDEITIYYWTLLDNSDIGLVLNTLEGYDYLKAALNEPTTIIGGLILTSAIELGYTASDGHRWTTAGISGIRNDVTNNTDIAAWFGGYRKDPVEYVNGRTGDARNIDYTVRPSGATWNYPQTLFRLDGSGYIGGLNSDNIPAIQWDSQSLTIREDISVVDSNGNTISTLGDLGNYFEEYTLPNNAGTAIKLKNRYEGIISDGFISAFGYSGSSGGSGSDATSINGDPIILNNLADGDTLIYSSDNGGKWVNGPAGIAAIDTPNVGEVLVWSSGGAEWVDPDSSSEGLNVLSAKKLTTAIILWGNQFDGSYGLGTGVSGDQNSVSSLSYVGDIRFGGDNSNYTVKLSTTTWGNSLPSSNNTLYVYGNIVASGFISAFGTSSSGGSSSGDANSIAGKPVIEPQSWSGLDGKALVYDASENDGEGAWVIGDAGIQWPSGASTGYLLGWGSSSAEWVNPLGNNFTVKKAQYLSNEPSLWGHTFDGYNSITGDLSYVGDIYFGGNSSSNTIKLSTTAFSGTTQANTLYVTGNIVASGYISAYGSSNSGGSSSGDASSIGGKDVNITSLSDGQILMYDLLDDEWKNVDPDVIPLITLNGTGTTSASFYAPISAGSSGQIIGWDTTNSRPYWINSSGLSVSYATSSGTAGSATTASRLYSNVYLWGNSFNGSSNIGGGEDESDVASLNNVEDIVFGVISDESEEEETSDYVGLSLASNRDYRTTDTLYLYGILNSKGGISTTSLSASGTITSSTGIYFGNNFSWTSASTYTAELKRGTTSLFSITGSSNNNRTATLNATLTLGNSSYPKNLIVMGNDIFIGGTTHYLRYVPAASNVPAYLLTDLPIVSNSFISAYGVSTTGSGTNSGGNNSSEEPIEEPEEEPEEDPSEELNT